jgi:hypothetical protein
MHTGSFKPNWFYHWQSISFFCQCQTVLHVTTSSSNRVPQSAGHIRARNMGPSPPDGPSLNHKLRNRIPKSLKTPRRQYCYDFVRSSSVLSPRSRSSGPRTNFIALWYYKTRTHQQEHTNKNTPTRTRPILFII